MTAAFLKRLIQLVPVLLSIATLVFFLQRLVPGTPADAILGPDAPLEQKAQWLARFGFDKPVGEQYLTYLGGLFRGDFGRSFANYTPVFDLIRPRLWNTLQLATVAFCVSLAIATVSGVVSAYRAGKLTDKITALVSLLSISAPSFIVGPLLMWAFSVKLGWFPLTGNQSPSAFVLPAITLGAALAALTSRLVRSGIVDVLGEDYIRTARSKGLAPARILLKHALRNAFLPALTVLGMQLGVLLSGAVITEQIFSWPGLGSLTVESVQAREYNIVGACVLIMATIYVSCNFLVDVLYQILDPRVRL